MYFANDEGLGPKGLSVEDVLGRCLIQIFIYHLKIQNKISLNGKEILCILLIKFKRPYLFKETVISIVTTKLIEYHILNNTWTIYELLMTTKLHK